MSNPTTPFSWQMPTATDLVTDLPADFEVFGQAVATSMADLLGGTSGQILAKNSNTDMDFVWIANDQGDITGITATSPLTGGGTSGAITVGIQDGTTAQKGAVQLENSVSSTSTTTAAVPANVKTANDLAAAAIPKSTVTTNGDLIYGTGAGTVSRIGIGTTGQALLVSGGVPAWGTVGAGANWSLLGSSALSGANPVTISGISGKNQLLVVVSGASSAVAGETVQIRINAAAANYNQFGIQHYGPTTYSSGNLESYDVTGQSFIRMGYMSNAVASGVSGYLLIDGCNTSGVKTFTQAATGSRSGSNGQFGYVTGGIWNDAATVTSISVLGPAGNFDAGNVYVYSSAN
jgi:hypothetical protein